MPKVIADKAIKMSFLQTKPGGEFIVVRQLIEKCKAAGITDYSILKGFGSYDIIFIYASSAGYEPILTQTGPIQGILRSSRFFCFQYLLNDNDSREFFDTINNATFASVSFIKLKPDAQQPIDEIRKILESCSCKDTDSHRGFGFGTLGWVDLSIIKTHETFKELIDGVFWATNGSLAPVLKTYSYLAINYRKLPQDPSLAEDEKNLFALLQSYPQFGFDIDGSIKASILVSFYPCASASLVQFWKKRKYNVFSITGKDDFCVQPSVVKRFDQLLSDLLHFRAIHKAVVYSTETKFDKAEEIKDEEFNIVAEYNPAIVSRFEESNFSELENVFNKPTALYLLSCINSLNGLTQGISSDAFIDITSYIKYISKAGNKIKQNKGQIESVSFASQCAGLIKIAAELRLYGTHGTLEESVGQFTKLRGGVQKSLLAMEYFPESIIKRISNGRYKWSGFIITGAKEFLNLNEVIIVPYDTLWKPQNWWPIYHEIAHIVVDNRSDLMDPNISEIKFFLAGKEVKDYWFHLANEFAAEVIGYELGFFGNYNLYLDLVWKYLRDLLPGYDNIAPFYVYCIRTYFVKLYEDLYTNNLVDLEYISNYDNVYEDLLTHITFIKNTYFSEGHYSSIFDFSDAHFVAAQNAPIFKEMFPWIDKILRPFSVRYSLRSSKSLLKDKNIQKVADTILAGMRWDGDVSSPEAILYKMLEKSEITYEQSMSFIMTFWNLYKKSVVGSH